MHHWVVVYWPKLSFYNIQALVHPSNLMIFFSPILPSIPGENCLIPNPQKTSCASVHRSASGLISEHPCTHALQKCTGFPPRSWCPSSFSTCCMQSVLCCSPCVANESRTTSFPSHLWAKLTMRRNYVKPTKKTSTLQG